jgi:hypothetical protein
MRRNLDFDYSRRQRETSLVGAWLGASLPGVSYRMGPARERDDGDRDGTASAPDPGEREDLPYTVELWDMAKTSIEQVLAVAASASIGFAAFYGATREFPDRYITLRHKNSVISRWNEPRH